MAQKPKTKGLGRGLSALLADVGDEVQDKSGQTQNDSPRKSDSLVPIEKVRANPDQPRRDFSEADMKDLIASVKERGIIQPLIVRPDPGHSGDFQIVAGERRWRAAQVAQIHEVPVVIRELDDTEVLEIAIIENIQRSDLNAVEEAMGYRQLMDSFGHTQEKLAEVLGKSRPHIANLLRLLNLPDDVLGLLREGKLSAGHARALVTAETPSEIAREIIAKGLSVRQVEQLVKKGPITPKVKAPRAEKDADTRALEGDLTAQLKMKVTIEQKPDSESGKISIQYKDLDQLDALLQLLAQ